MTSLGDLAKKAANSNGSMSPKNYYQFLLGDNFTTILDKKLYLQGLQSEFQANFEESFQLGAILLKDPTHSSVNIAIYLRIHVRRYMRISKLDQRLDRQPRI